MILVVGATGLVGSEGMRRCAARREGASAGSRNERERKDSGVAAPRVLNYASAT